MDAYRYSIGLVVIEADGEDPVYLTNRQENIIIDGNLYVASPEMELDLPNQGGDMSASDGAIKALKAQSGILANISGGYPYNQIKVTIREVELNDALVVQDSNILFTGLVYQSESLSHAGFLTLIIKDWKYYTDVPAGEPCTEQCWVAYFGEPKMCQATVQEFAVTVDAVDGNVVVLGSVPSVVDFLFHKGYFKLRGTSIKIKFWESGTIFQTSEPMPSSWVGEAITLVAGCDKLLATCRDIHDNEENFSGWGHSMVDYNSQTEDG